MEDRTVMEWDEKFSGNEMLLQTNNRLTLTNDESEGFLNVSRFRLIILSCPPGHGGWRERGRFFFARILDHKRQSGLVSCLTRSLLSGTVKV
jgi:hypothetical protein